MVFGQSKPRRCESFSVGNHGVWYAVIPKEFNTENFAWNSAFHYYRRRINYCSFSYSTPQFSTIWNVKARETPSSKVRGALISLWSLIFLVLRRRQKTVARTRYRVPVSLSRAFPKMGQRDIRNYSDESRQESNVVGLGRPATRDNTDTLPRGTKYPNSLLFPGRISRPASLLLRRDASARRFLLRSRSFTRCESKLCDECVFFLFFLSFGYLIIFCRSNEAGKTDHSSVTLEEFFNFGKINATWCLHWIFYELKFSKFVLLSWLLNISNIIIILFSKFSVDLVVYTLVKVLIFSWEFGANKMFTYLLAK